MGRHVVHICVSLCGSLSISLSAVGGSSWAVGHMARFETDLAQSREDPLTWFCHCDIYTILSTSGALAAWIGMWDALSLDPSSLPDLMDSMREEFDQVVGAFDLDTD